MARLFQILPTDQGSNPLGLWQRLAPNPIPRPTVDAVDQGSSLGLWQRLSSQPIPRPTVDAVDQGSSLGLWQRLSSQPIPRPTVDTQPFPTQPFIDGIAPVTVGSDWRAATLMAAKFNDNVTLPQPSIQPGDTLSSADTSSFFIPCGDRIPEFGDVLVDGYYELPSGPGLDDNRTIIILNSTVVYMNGAAQNGWAVLSEPNLINGFNYTLVPPSLLPVGLYSLNIYLEGVESFQDAIDFDVQDFDPPILQNLNPDAYDTKVALDATIDLEIIDVGAGVDAYSVVLKVDGVTAWTGRASQPGFSVLEMPAVDGYSYAIDPDSGLPIFQWVTVGVYAEDLISNVLDTTYRFKTEDPNTPFLTNLSPTDGSIGNPRDGYVELAVVDPEGLVDGSTIRIDINGSVAFDASFDVFYPPFDSPASAVLQGTFDGYDGYGILLQRVSDFASYELVEVRVRAEDYGENLLDRTYSFRIEDYTGPVFANVSPTPGSENIAQNTLIKFDIYDPGSGVDLTTLRVYVDSHTAYDGYDFIAPYDGYGSEVTGPFLIDGYDGYHVAVQSTSDYPSGGRVYVDVIISDEEGN